MVRVPVLVSTSVYVCSWSGLAAEYYVGPSTGKDSNTGSFDEPWRTLAGSVGKLQPGDTLYLRGGSYFEYDDRIEVAGTESRPIAIRNYGGEVLIVDGSYSDFRDAPNSDWETVDPERGIWRSAKKYAAAGIVHAYLGPEHGGYHLVPYERLEHLSAEN